VGKKTSRELKEARKELGIGNGLEGIVLDYEDRLGKWAAGGDGVGVLSSATEILQRCSANLGLCAEITLADVWGRLDDDRAVVVADAEDEARRAETEEDRETGAGNAEGGARHEARRQASAQKVDKETLKRVKSLEKEAVAYFIEARGQALLAAKERQPGDSDEEEGAPGGRTRPGAGEPASTHGKRLAVAMAQHNLGRAMLQAGTKALPPPDGVPANAEPEDDTSGDGARQLLRAQSSARFAVERAVLTQDRNEARRVLMRVEQALGLVKLREVRCMKASPAQEEQAAADGVEVGALLEGLDAGPDKQLWFGGNALEALDHFKDMLRIAYALKPKEEAEIAKACGFVSTAYQAIARQVSFHDDGTAVDGAPEHSFVLNGGADGGGAGGAAGKTKGGKKRRGEPAREVELGEDGLPLGADWYIREVAADVERGAEKTAETRAGAPRRAAAFRLQQDALSGRKLWADADADGGDGAGGSPTALIEEWLAEVDAETVSGRVGG
jgi:hypothetical protein